MKKENVKLIFAIIISVLLSTLVNALASGNLFDSNEVIYDNTSSGMSSSNVKAAVDELYAVANDYADINSRLQVLEGYLDGTDDYFGTKFTGGENRWYFNGSTLVLGQNRTTNAMAGGLQFNDLTNNITGWLRFNGANTVYLDSIKNGVSGDGDIDLHASTVNLGKAGATVKIGGTNIIDLIYPVGSIYISTTDDTVAKVQNRFPNTTWASFGSGRTIVGVNGTDTDFNTVEKTGGQKAHSHAYGLQYGVYWGNVSLEGNSNAGLLNYNTSNNYTVTGQGTLLSNSNAYVNGSTTGAKTQYSMAHFKQTANVSYSSTLQPYITVYMYKRTA